MSLRLSTKGFSTFISFNSCIRQISGLQSRTLSSYRSRCLRIKPPPFLPGRHGDKRHLHSTAPCGAAAKNPYSVLGIKRDASAAEIKKTYFALARKYHPDTNPDKGARDKFVEIQEAYDILKDEKKRAAYDRHGSASQSPGFDPNAFSDAGGFSGFGGGNPFGAGRAAGGFSFGGSFGGGPTDLFEQLFSQFDTSGGRPRNSEFSKGGDVEVTLNVTFLEACKGTKKTIDVAPIGNCESCEGSGLKKGLKRKTCSGCGGSGTQTFVLESGFQMATTCSSCRGTGSTIPRGGECSGCSGAGKVRNKATFTVNVGAGAEDGMIIRGPSGGDAPLVGKGPKGDLLVRLKVASSPIFQRQGSNLYHQSKVPFHRALLGGVVRVPTLDGEVDVRMPVGTQQGEEMVLKGRGIASKFEGRTGDLFVTFSLQLPRHLTPRQKSLLQEYADDVEGVSRSSSTPPPKGAETSTSTTDAEKETLSKDNEESEKSEETSTADETDERSKKDEQKRATG